MTLVIETRCLVKISTALSTTFFHVFMFLFLFLLPYCSSRLLFIDSFEMSHLLMESINNRIENDYNNRKTKTDDWWTNKTYTNIIGSRIDYANVCLRGKPNSKTRKPAKSKTLKVVLTVELSHVKFHQN